MRLQRLGEGRGTAVAVEDCEEAVFIIGEGHLGDVSIFHVDAPAWVGKGVPHMWVTA